MSTSPATARLLLAAIAALAIAPGLPSPPAGAQTPAGAASTAAAAESVLSADEARQFQGQVQPLLERLCFRCHGAAEMKSGIRLDLLDTSLDDRQFRLWQGVLKQLDEEAMPPEDELQPTKDERQQLTAWIRRALEAAQLRQAQKNGSVRRLTVSQYRNTLRDLLQLQEDFTDILPPDPLSKDGFANNGQTLELSPLQVEAYFDIADQALAAGLIDVDAAQRQPVIQNFRVDLGASINPNPCPDNLVLGALSVLLANQDFVVTELSPDKPFAYQPFAMRRAYEFIEGYQGNDTVREWRKFDSIYHSVFACMRGTNGYPKGEAYRTVPAGLLLRPAIPSPEIFGESSTYGPRANFKISLRELPDHGNFRVTVKAARYRDALLLDAGAPLLSGDDRVALEAAELSASAPATVTMAAAGIYQVAVRFVPGEDQILSLDLGERNFSGQLFPTTTPRPAEDGDEAARTAAFLLVRLPAGPLACQVRYGDNSRLRNIELVRIADDSPAAEQFRQFEQRAPWLGVHLGLRRDCGSTLGPVGSPQVVESYEPQEYVFEGAIRDFPSPHVEQDNVNYLAGIREIGVRSEFIDGRDMPRLLIQSVEFEGPYYETWPPAAYRNIYLESEHSDDPPAYAREIIRSFATRAFRRPLVTDEEAALFAVWQTSFAAHGHFQRGIHDALLVVLTSPQFLFLMETSQGPEPEPLDAYELAAKLSYFLWNTAPDDRLLELAAQNQLHAALDAEIERLLDDPRSMQFLREFTSQWLSLDKFDVVEVNQQRFPQLTRDTRRHLREEPIQWVQYLISENLPLRHLVESEWLLANDVVANYYSLSSRPERGFTFVPVRHGQEQLGGVLSQAAILAGLSDGRESNPVKRGAWLARKILAEPPDDPPPNVPELKEDEGANLTLREKLERHRNQAGCAKCHAGIDPWGLPLEDYSAGGLRKLSEQIDSQATLPDGTSIENALALKAYLAQDRIDQVAFSFLKHLASYAVGRSLNYSELVSLRKNGLEWKSRAYPTRDLLRQVIKSELFLTK